LPKPLSDEPPLEPPELLPLPLWNPLSWLLVPQAEAIAVHARNAKTVAVARMARNRSSGSSAARPNCVSPSARRALSCAAPMSPLSALSRCFLVLTPALLCACSSDAQLKSRFASGFAHPSHTLAVLGVYKDGRMSSEAWEAVGPGLSRPRG
jgi:hypothetical protein